ncbi:MAG: efflux RND transporter periplasmic adaptor subunit [Pseudomonadota bacterium]
MSDAATMIRTREAGPSLAEALTATFEGGQDVEAFATRVTHLAASLTNGPAAYLVAPDGAVLGATTRARPPDAVLALTADPARGTARADGAFGVVEMALPAGDTAALVLQLPPGGTVAGALALERMTSLAALSYARFRHPDLTAQAALFEAIARGPEGLEAIASALQNLTDADFVALGEVQGGVVETLAISGQTPQAKRAALPDTLRRELADQAARPAQPPEHLVAHGPGGAFAARISAPRRNAALAPVVLQALAAGDGLRAGRGQRRMRRLVRAAAFALALIGLAFVPLPDGQRIAAEVTAVSERVITAPYTSALAEVAVRPNDRVVAGETVLARLDDALITQELIAAQSDYAKALLDRETARAGRDAQALRTAELEAERLRAEIALLEARAASAVLIAPISGAVAGDGLGDLTGATVRQGEVLMRVLDPSELRLNLEITDEAVADVGPGAAGVFRPDFNPTLRFGAQVTSVSPALSDRQDVAVFAGRAAFVEGAAGLSPGLRGVLAVSREWRPVWEVVWTGLRDWVLLRVWV